MSSISGAAETLCEWLRAHLQPIFTGAFIVGFVGVILSAVEAFHLKRSDAAVLFGGLLAAGIVWWQGYLIKEQMQLQAILDLDKEWHSKEMLARRGAAWDDQNKANKYRIEDVLEFLEKVSTFERKGVISASLIWDTFGWYIWRYYYYSRGAIDDLRHEWTPLQHDPTLYQDLERLFGKLFKLEIENRNERNKSATQLTNANIEEELDRTRERFIYSERRGQ